jgi:E1-E2 ATPase
VFATPIALWTSSVFHIGAFYALKSRVLNMSVLVSLGILTSCLFSVGRTLFAPSQETFYEAAVMLAAFLLFGHWMEMKARRGSSDSVRKLLDLAPKRATVERDSSLVEVPVADVVVGDTVVLRPGDSVPVDGEVLDGTSALTRAWSPARACRWRRVRAIRSSPGRSTSQARSDSAPQRWVRTPRWRRSFDWSRRRRTAKRQPIVRRTT